MCMQYGDYGNRKKAFVVVLIVLIACGLTFYAMGIRQKQELSMYQNRITLFQKDRQFYTYEDAVQMRQRNEEIKEPFSYVIWGTEGYICWKIRIWDGPAGWKCMP